MAFSVSNGQIIGPNGQPFFAEGIDLGDPETAQLIANPTAVASEITTDFPGINMVQISAADGPTVDTAAALAPFVNLMTSKGIVVEIADYNEAFTQQVPTGAALTAEVNWFSSLATTFKGNANVWFSPANEPEDAGGGGGTAPAGSVSAEQLAVYNAIRATGSTAIFGLEGATASNLVASDYANMTNVYWDDHYYDWESGYSSNPTTLATTLQGVLAPVQAITSAEGTIPIIIGEFGDSTDGSTVDSGGDALVQYVTSQTQYGWTAWGLNPGGTADLLTNSNGSVSTPYGQIVASAIAAGHTTTGTGSGGSGTGTSGNGAILIKPGSGSFTDAAGNVYTIDASENADENGKPIPGGGGTAEMEYYNGVVYGEDAGGSGWYIWNQTSWEKSGAPPAPTTGSGGTTPPPPAPTVVSTITTSPGSGSVTVGGTVTLTVTFSAAVTVAGGTPTLALNDGGTASYASGSGSTALVFKYTVAAGQTTNDLALASNAVALNGATIHDASGNNAVLTAANGYNPAGTLAITAPVIPPPPPPPVVSTTDFFITPGVGTFKDTAGNTYSVDSNENAIENGKDIPGGGGTSAMAYFNGKVLGQDAGGSGWYTWNQTTWASAPPSLSDVTTAGTLTRNLSQTGTVTENGDTFVLSSGNVVKATLGSGNDNIGFIGGKQVTLTGGSGTATVLVAGGTGTFAAGTGSLDVTAGGGKDAFVYHATSGLLTLEDFSTTSDTLTIDKALQSSLVEASDGKGGTMLSFGIAGHGVDIRGLATLSSSHITWA